MSALLGAAGLGLIAGAAGGIIGLAVVGTVWALVGCWRR